MTIHICKHGIVLRHRQSQIPIVGTEFALSDLKGWRRSKSGETSELAMLSAQSLDLDVGSWKCVGAVALDFVDPDQSQLCLAATER
eukprot:SAG31_NODE_23250_length_508_cov_0.623472_2_plen_85_part_01